MSNKISTGVQAKTQFEYESMLIKVLGHIDRDVHVCMEHNWGVKVKRRQNEDKRQNTFLPLLRVVFITISFYITIISPLSPYFAYISLITTPTCPRHPELQRGLLGRHLWRAIGTRIPPQMFLPSLKFRQADNLRSPTHQGWIPPFQLLHLVPVLRAWTFFRAERVEELERRMMFCRC